MDRDQYREWATDFAEHQPVAGKKLKDLPRASHDTFHELCFADLALEDCMEATRRLVKDIEHVSVDRIPAMVSKLAQEIAWERKHPRGKTRFDTPSAGQKHERARGGGMVEAFEAAAAAHAQGLGKVEIHRRIDAAFAKHEDTK